MVFTDETMALGTALAHKEAAEDIGKDTGVHRSSNFTDL